MNNALISHHDNMSHIGGQDRMMYQSMSVVKLLYISSYYILCVVNVMGSMYCYY